MRSLIKNSMIRTLGIVDAFPVRSTESGEVRALLDRLYPIACDKPLIRLGPCGDGGYLIPDDLGGIEACFSPGVDLVSGFEKDCAARGIHVFLADNTVEQPAEEDELFHFTKKFVGAFSNDDFMTLDRWVDSVSLSKHSDLMLQMDVEGSEYEVFFSMSEALMERLRIIVVEFHALNQLWDKNFFKIASRVFDRILYTHSPVHIHPNNCCGSLKKKGLDIPVAMEFTFLRRDRILRPRYEQQFPNCLDCDNVDKAGLVLPECWYKQN